jgi:copper chaperone
MKFSVPDMSCGHCTATIEKSIKAFDQAATVACDTDNRLVEVTSTLCAEAQAAAIKVAGYDATITA